MGETGGFLRYERQTSDNRSVHERIRDWNEIPLKLPIEKLKDQGARCMECGTPFCHGGCPLGNLIPDFNDSIYQGQWLNAILQLHSTNNFPEFTGRLCPAPCESACVLGITHPSVAIKEIEKAIVERAWEEGWIKPEPPEMRTHKKIAVVGSGPAGLAVASQLNRAGHSVTVLERADRIGGLLRYGIPDFKLEKHIIDRRIQVMQEEGISFRTKVWIGRDYPVEILKKDFDAICLTCGSTRPRDLRISGRELKGIHFAMDYLSLQNRLNQSDGTMAIPGDNDLMMAKDKEVVVIGGGDTGSDCVGTALRQGAKNITQIELLPKPPKIRTKYEPWPYYPHILRTSTSQEEGCQRLWGIQTCSFVGDSNGRVKALKAKKLKWSRIGDGPMKSSILPHSEFELSADLVLLAMGFLGPEREGFLDKLGVALDARGNILVDDHYKTNVDNVFAAGDCHKGQSLIVWAIAEGREAAHGINQYLMGTSNLPLNNNRTETL